MKRHLSAVRKYPLTNPKAWKFKNSALKLDWNESDENLPEAVLQEAFDRLKQHNLNWYPPIFNEPLTLAISDYVNLPTDYIRYAPGSDAINECLLTAMLNYGDVVCIVSPNYDHFRNIAEVHGADVRYFSAGAEINYSELDIFIGSTNPIAVYISSPNNPTGVCFDNQELIYLIGKYRSTYFIVDEAYYEFCEKTSAGFVLEYENLAVTRSLSKAFGAASIRFGYLLASREIINLYDLVANVKATPLFTQIMAEVILRNGDYVVDRVNRVRTNREKVFELLRKFEIAFINSEANFVLIMLDCPSKKSKLIQELEESCVFIRDYSHLKQTENAVRITIGSSEKFRNFLIEFEKILGKIYAKEVEASLVDSQS